MNEGCGTRLRGCEVARLTQQPLRNSVNSQPRKQPRNPVTPQPRNPATTGDPMNRRIFLKSSGLALVSGALLPNVFVRMANAATTKGRKVVVAIFQRGAVDGLNVVVPHGEKAYYDARPTIAIPKSDVVDLDGFFGVPPSLASLVPYFKNKSAAFV